MAHDPRPRVVVAHPHVDTSGDIPLVAGTDLPVHRLWLQHRRGVPVALLLRRHPDLGPARLLDALSFAYDNPSLIEQAAVLGLAEDTG